MYLNAMGLLCVVFVEFPFFYTQDLILQGPGRTLEAFSHLGFHPRKGGLFCQLHLLLRDF